VAFIEGQVSEQSHALQELRDSVRHLEQRVDTLEQRLEARHDSTGRRIDALEDKVSRQFVWTVGVQVSTFVAIVAALLARG
jgi:uncharacterized coiled-coil protein SlyX